MRKELQTIEKSRTYTVGKSNQFVRQARFSLSLQEMKILNYLFSLIKKEDDVSQTFTFSVPQYCRIAGLEEDNGGNYASIKKSLKNLADKSYWVDDGEHDKTTSRLVRWIDNITVESGGTIHFNFTDDIQQYIIGEGNMTVFTIGTAIAMSSSYSIRMYELLKSYIGTLPSITQKFTLEDLRTQIGIEEGTLTSYSNFRIRVLDVSMRDINEFSDINVEYEPITIGKKVVELKFAVWQKTKEQKIKARQKINDKLDKPGRQRTIQEYMS